MLIQNPLPALHTFIPDGIYTIEYIYSSRNTIKIPEGVALRLRRISDSHEKYEK